MAGRPAGSQNKDKPFRDALRMELAAAGEDHKALRMVAVALLGKAAMGDVPAIKEIADRLDGKVAQPVGGTDELPPQAHTNKIEILIVDPSDTDSTGIQAATEAGEVQGS